MPWRYYFLSFTCKDIDVVTVTVMCNFSFDIQNFLMQEANVLYLCFLWYGFDRNLNIFRCVFFPFSLLILYSISAYLLNLLKSAGLFPGCKPALPGFRPQDQSGLRQRCKDICLVYVCRSFSESPSVSVPSSFFKQQRFSLRRVDCSSIQLWPFSLLLILCFWYALNVSRMMTDCVEDASIAIRENT